MGGGEVQGDVRRLLPHPATDLHQPQPQRRQFHRFLTRCHECAPQSVEQAVGRRVEQQAELVGGKAVATVINASYE